MLEINFRMAFQIRKKNKNTHNFTIPQPGHLRQFYQTVFKQALIRFCCTGVKTWKEIDNAATELA